jgi:hypothetical protein
LDIFKAGNCALEVTCTLIGTVEQDVVGVVHMANLHEKLVKILLIFTQSDSHREEILEFSNEGVEHQNQPKEDMTIFENSFSLKMGSVVLSLGIVFFLLINSISFLVQVLQVLDQQSLDLVSLDALVFHFRALLSQSLVDVDDQVGQTFCFYLILLLKLLYHVVPLDAVFLQVLLLDLFESDLRRLLCFDLLELFFSLNKQLQKFLET